MDKYIRVKNCNCISDATIEIVEKSLNIKYGSNGTGKSTISEAIYAQANNETDRLKDFKPYGSNDNSQPTVDNPYIPNECVVLDSSLSEEDSPFYKDDKIACLDVDKIVKRNEQKSENLDYLSSCTTIKVKQKTVPYSVYYVSCNLDHYLHRSANLDYRMKRSLADTFARTYIGDVEGFIKEISDDPGAVKGMSYDESWNYIKEDKNSLHRHTNLNLLFEKLLAKAES